MRNLNLIPILLLASSLAWATDDAPKTPPCSGGAPPPPCSGDAPKPEVKPAPKVEAKILPDTISLRWWRSTTEVLRTEQAYKAAIEAQRKALDEATAFCGAQPVAGVDNGPACPAVPVVVKEKK